jgi:cytochrome c oxidase cbb3-type subunit 3
MKKATTSLGILLLAGTQAFAQTVTTAANINTTTPVVVSNYSPYQDPIFYGLILVATMLLIYILQLQGVLKALANKAKRDRQKQSRQWPTTILIILIYFGSSNAASAATGDQMLKFLHDGFGNTPFNALFTLIVIELSVVLYFNRMIKYLTTDFIGLKEGAPEALPERVGPSFWIKFHQSVEIKDEAAILTDHDYDGIRELDNALPPWWKYGFYLTIVWAFGYMAYFHAGGNGPSSLQEYQTELAEAKKQMEEYRLNAKNLVDETTVAVLTGSEDLKVGSALFASNCVSCHGANAEGKIGPNLTDQYWKNGGDIKNLFKTVKIGVTGTGMKSWKNDLSAMQMAQVTSYILSLQGTNPANPKAPEGPLYKAPVDSTATAISVLPDSTASAKK